MALAITAFVSIYSIFKFYQFNSENNMPALNNVLHSETKSSLSTTITAQNRKKTFPIVSPSQYRDELIQIVLDGEENLFLTHLDKVNVENLEDFINALHVLPEELTFRRSFEKLYYHWGLIDPRAALDYGLARENTYPPQWYAGVGEAIRAWTSYAPQAVAHYLDTTALETWHQASFAEIAAFTLVRKNSENAKAWAQSLNKPSANKNAMATVALRLAANKSEDQSETFNWITTNADKPGAEAAIKIWARERAAIDPLQAIDQVLKTPQDDLRYAAIHSLINEWAGYQPTETGNWINQQAPSPEVDAAIAGYAQAIYRGFPNEALEWAESIDNSEKRTSIVSNIERFQAAKGTIAE